MKRMTFTTLVLNENCKQPNGAYKFHFNEEEKITDSASPVLFLISTGFNPLYGETDAESIEQKLPFRRSEIFCAKSYNWSDELYANYSTVTKPTLI